MDAFLLILVFVFMAIIIMVNLYILAYYSHPLEARFGGSIFAKIMIVSIHNHPLQKYTTFSSDIHYWWSPQTFHSHILYS